MVKVCWKCKFEVPDVSDRCMWCGAYFRDAYSSLPPADVAREELRKDPENEELQRIVRADDERIKTREDELKARLDAIDRGKKQFKIKEAKPLDWKTVIIGAVASAVIFQIIRMLLSA